MKRMMTIMGLAVAILVSAAAASTSTKNPTSVLRGDGNPPPCSPLGCGNGGH